MWQTLGGAEAAALAAPGCWPTPFASGMEAKMLSLSVGGTTKRSSSAARSYWPSAKASCDSSRGSSMPGQSHSQYLHKSSLPIMLKSCLTGGASFPLQADGR